MLRACAGLSALSSTGVRYSSTLSRTRIFSSCSAASSEAAITCSRTSDELISCCRPCAHAQTHSVTHSAHSAAVSQILSLYSFMKKPPLLCIALIVSAVIFCFKPLCGIILAIAVLRHSRRRASKVLRAASASSYRPNTAEPVPVMTAPSAPPSSIALFIPAISLCRRSGTSSNTLYILRAIFGRSPSLRSSMIPCVSGWQRSLTASSRLNSSGVDTEKSGLQTTTSQSGIGGRTESISPRPEAS